MANKFTVFKILLIEWCKNVWHTLFSEVIPHGQDGKIKNKWKQNIFRNSVCVP